MDVASGDRIVIRGKAVGNPDRRGTVLEVRGDEGQGPYVIRFDDGRESLVYPGPDFVVTPE
ncbi:MAG TPA: DUF1918 domain-containing protein [Microbacteriaceae bacterium]|nr:DUF1918 domain-containing protein [Microbacteriaceae bacterium]